MPRAERVLVEGGLYHVYNRLGRGERVFDGEAEAGRFVELLREVVKRDELTVFAWCLLPNHYHLAVKMGPVPLGRAVSSIQYRLTRYVNLRSKVLGPLWQGRFKCKLIADQQYFDQLLAYIHLNPVSAGIVQDPAEYTWSGHRDILGKTKTPIVDVDEVLRLFGKTRRGARTAYVRTLNREGEQEWVGEDPGSLPWWRLGRPPKGESEDPEVSIREKRRRDRQGPEWRASIQADDFVSRSAVHLGIEREELNSRSQATELVRAREVVMVLGIERYGLKVKDLAREMQKSPDGMSKALARGARRRKSDGEFRLVIEDLDQAISGGEAG